LYLEASQENGSQHTHSQFSRGKNAANLMINAEIAMYRAKEKSDKVIVLFDESMKVDSAWRLDFENDLRRAIDRSELFLHFQPKVELASSRICGAEALIRWQHPRSGLVSPADFIRIAEEVGLIIPIGRWLLEAACKQLVAWRAAGICLVPIAVNLGTPHIRQRGLASEISLLLSRYDLDASLLHIEVTESLMMDDLEVSLNTLNELREIGIEIAIDAFGVGYYSLAYLKRLPITTLKIDRVFIRNITIDPDDAAISSAILAMAHRLGLKVVVEGVETAEQLEFLRAHNCEQYQGYFFSRPVMPEQIEALLRQQDMEDLPS
jgi:EAL domain-containing protein (putative c-di-GMP-specific phosphodiesterase class I)